MSWDLYAKALMHDAPQDFVTLLAPGARYVGHREGQFQTREIRSDSMIEAEYNGRGMLIHVEFQSEKDEKMATRLLGYSYEAIREHGLPVLSCVIYLQRTSDVPQPPLNWDLPIGRRVMWFDYISIELAEWPLEDLKQLDLDAMLPLLILSKGGAKREVLAEAIARLDAGNKRELLLNAQLFAGLVFKSADDQAWLERSFAVLNDYLREHSWTYQKIIREGIEQGRAEGLQLGQLLAIRQNIEATVQARFPTLLTAVKAQIKQITDPAALQKISLTVNTARTAKEVKQYLLDLHTQGKSAGA